MVNIEEMEAKTVQASTLCRSMSQYATSRSMGLISCDTRPKIAFHFPIDVFDGDEASITLSRGITVIEADQGP